MYTKDFIETILNYSKDNNVSEKEASIHFNVNPKSLTYYKKKYGFSINSIGKGQFTYRPTRKYDVNDNFFETPNILNCYWAGFIAADGCINKKKKQDQLSLGLAIKDRKHLETFKSDIKFDGPIHKLCVEKEYMGEKKIFECVSMAITSQKISDDLCDNFNITSKKSLILLPPNITDKELIDAFICGYIDGDGSITLYKNNTRNIQDSLSISILGTLEMMTWIKNRFSEILGKDYGSISHYKEGKNAYSYTIGASKGAREIFKHFYSLNIPKLERKWTSEKYEYCINFKKKKPLCRRKGVNVFDLDGNLIKHFDLIAEASEYTGVSIGRISNMCRLNDSMHRAHCYMFSRDDTMKKYEGSKFVNTKYINP